MEKNIIDRRLSIIEEEGINFFTNKEVGKNYSVNNLKKYDSIVLCGGATIKRNLPIKGSDLDGVKQAMDFLKLQNEVVDGLNKTTEPLNAKDKNVIVIGGGDTGSDCIGTSNRKEAKSVTNFEIMSKQNENRTDENPWPYWPFKLKTTSSHEEGIHREWSILTKEFIGDENGKVKSLKTVEVEWIKKEGERPQLKEISGSEKLWPCDLALLALGFTGHEPDLIDKLNLETNISNQIVTNNYQTSVSNIFSAGDMRR